MKNKTIKQLVVNAMFIALLVVSSFITIPINQIPYTLQLLVVFIILMTLNFKNSLIIFITYLVMGLIGLPVFSGFTCGITETFGFLVGIVLSPFVYYTFNKMILIKNNNIKKFIVCFLCLIFINILGSLFLMIYLSMNFFSSLVISLASYLLLDILKIIIAIIIQKRIILIYKQED